MLPNPLQQVPLEVLRQRTSAKWRAYPDDVLPLWVAEMDVMLAPPVRDALMHAIEIGDTGYPAGHAYAAAIKQFAEERWGWDGVEMKRTAMVPDVMMGIVEVLRLLTQPGDRVVVTAPVYAPFYAFVEHAGRHIIESNLGLDGRIDMTNLEAALGAAQTACANPVLLLSNPHNPTGTVHTRMELEQVAQLAVKYGVRVISDEIHAPLVYEPAKFTPYVSVDPRGFAVLSASKAWNLAGLKAALVIAGEGAADDLARMPEEVSHGPSHLGLIAHTAGFRDGGEWLDSLLDGLKQNRALLSDLVAEHLPEALIREPEGTYLGWLDCRAYDLGSAPKSDGPAIVSDLAGPAKFFLDEARVALSSGHVFGTGGDGFVRVNFGTSPEILTEAITRMGSAILRRG